jgi:hypothetical protein
MPASLVILAAELWSRPCRSDVTTLHVVLGWAEELKAK